MAAACDTALMGRYYGGFELSIVFLNVIQT